MNLAKFSRSPRTWTGLALLTVLVLVLGSTVLASGLAAPAALTFAVSPSSQSAPVGSTFTVDVRITDAVDLQGFQFTLSYDATKVEFQSASVGGFLTSTGRTFGGSVGPATGAGQVTYGASTNGATPAGPNGPGTLATLTFVATAPGTSALNLSAGKATDTKAAVSIPAYTNGSVTLVQSSTLIAVGSATKNIGDLFDVPVTIQNAANLSAFQFTVNYDPNIVEVMDVDLGAFLLSTGRTLGGEVGPTIGGGKVTYGAFTNGATPAGPNGSGTLAILKLKALKSGTTSLGLSGLSVSNTAGVTQTPAGQNGNVTVLGPQFRIAPASQSVLIGSNLTVDVSVDNAKDLSAYQFTLTWNPAILQYVSYQTGTFLTSTGRGPVIPAGPTIAAGSFIFGEATQGATPAGPNGSGMLVRLTFKALAAGTSPADLTAGSVSDTNGVNYPVTLTDGSVTVTLPPTPYPGLGGWVFIDKNSNGFRDYGETDGVSGVKIELRNKQGVVVKTTTSVAPEGWYQFQQVAAGDYTIVQTQPAGYTSTSPDSVNVTVTSGTNIVNFGEVLIVTPTPTATPFICIPGPTYTPYPTYTPHPLLFLPSIVR